MPIPSGFEFTGAGWYDKRTGEGPYVYDGARMILMGSGGTSSNAQISTIVETYSAVAAGTGYSVGDTLRRLELFDTVNNASISVTWTNLTTGASLASAPAPSSVALTVPTSLTDQELRASPVDVVGPLTDAELRAAPVDVVGTLNVTGALTDAELRASPVPVSGPLTSSQLSSAGLSTEAKQDDIITALDTLDQTGQRIEVEAQGINTHVQQVEAAVQAVDSTTQAVGSAVLLVEAAIQALPQTQGLTLAELQGESLATEAKQNDLNAAVGTAADAAFVGTGSGTAVAVLKGIYENTKAGANQTASWSGAVTGSGTVAAGATEVSFVNIGAAPGTLQGNAFPNGLAVVFTARDGKKLGAIAYNATGTTYYISEVR